MNTFCSISMDNEIGDARIVIEPDASLSSCKITIIESKGTRADIYLSKNSLEQFMYLLEMFKKML